MCRGMDCLAQTPAPSARNTQSGLIPSVLLLCSLLRFRNRPGPAVHRRHAHGALRGSHNTLMSTPMMLAITR